MWLCIRRLLVVTSCGEVSSQPIIVLSKTPLSQIQPYLAMASVAFPRRLYDILSTENPGVVGWNPDGKSFRINDNGAFCNDILPR
jgi:hypothetical protein